VKSKLMLFVVWCSLFATCMGQWSSPVPLLCDNSPITGQSLVAGAGDTMWATAIVGQAGSTGPHQVLASWTTGDTWSLPVELTSLDSGRVFSEPGMGRDASDRLWVAWYRGDYPTQDDESSAVWTALRDSSGWHPAARAISGVAAEGPMSFTSDAAGNWYLGFATLALGLDVTYSSATYSRWTGDSWLTPRYLARGTGSPIPTDFSSPVLAPRPNSGIWAAYEMIVGGDEFLLLKIIRNDSARWCWGGDGSAPAVTVDSAGRLWILYSLMSGYLLSSVVIADSVEVAAELVSEYSIGRAHTATDFEGVVWVAWQHRSYHWVSVNYSTGGSWSAPEQTSALAGIPKGIAADANGRMYVLFRTAAGQLYSVYRTVRPGVEELCSGPPVTSRVATIARRVLYLHSAQFTIHTSLFDMTGRQVMALRPGANDVSRLSPGVYFVQEAQAQAQAVRKVVIQR
jgi:hypothetical protein